MKAVLVSLGMMACVLGTSVPVAAHDAYDDSESHPLRVLAYALHPVGFAIEWAVLRPFHFLVSNPSIENVTGHVAHENPYGGYTQYDPERR